MRLPRRVYTLCGSSRFKKEHEEAQARLSLNGHIVIPMGTYGHQYGLDMEGEVKKKLDELHLDKIDMSDAIFVVNPEALACRKCGGYVGSAVYCIAEVSHCCSEAVKVVPYIGKSTREEIAYAKAKGKAVEYLNDPAES